MKLGSCKIDVDFIKVIAKEQHKNIAQTVFILILDVTTYIFHLPAVGKTFLNIVFYHHNSKLLAQFRK